MNVPPHLTGVRLEDAPEEIARFANEYGADRLFFIDDPIRCKNSVRYHQTAFINSRCTYWANLIPPPFSCCDAYEAIVLRTLHELGHVHGSHPGDERIASTPTGLAIERSQDFYTQHFTGTEGEAWEFAFRIRATRQIDFARMYRACRDWYRAHHFADKDWDEGREDQWRRRHRRDVRQEQFTLPAWVHNAFNKYRGNGV